MAPKSGDNCSVAVGSFPGDPWSRREPRVRCRPEAWTISCKHDLVVWLHTVGFNEKQTVELVSDLLFSHAFGVRAVMCEGYTVKHSALQWRVTILGVCACARLSWCGQVLHEVCTLTSLYRLRQPIQTLLTNVKEYWKCHLPWQLNIVEVF